MKITSVELHPANSSEIAVLSFRDPKRINPYNVKTIVGLDADQIVTRFYKGSGNSGRFYNLTLEKRNIIVRIELNPSFATGSYSDLRDALYKMISSSRTGSIEIKFKNGTNVLAVISGFISKFEAPNFTKTPEVQITVNCSNTMLQAPLPVYLDTAAIIPTAINFRDDISTAPHGFAMQIGVLEPATTFTISDPNDPNWSFQATPVNGFFTDDILAFSSELNNKYFYIIRGVTPIYLADVITPESVWPIQFPGDNLFTIAEMSKMTFLSVSYYPTYWGV